MNSSAVTFTSIDVETANADLSSICQIGVVQFEDERIVRRWNVLVNPHDYFDCLNVSIHGIDEARVADAPSFPEVHERLHAYLTSGVITCHTSFDRSAIQAAHDKHGIPVPEITWLDTARVVRRAWPDRARAGFGLGPVAQMLGIEFQHHDAEEDARAAGEILLRAIKQTGLSVQDWLRRIEQPIVAQDKGQREANREGPLFGEIAVFTGFLSRLRKEAADRAAKAGCRVDLNVTNGTTLLVVGDQDVARLGGNEKSRKHRNAEARMAEGQAIRILTETDFERLLLNPPH